MIANDLEKRRFIAIDIAEQNVDMATTLGSLSVVSLMVRAGQKLFNDLIFFLAKCPGGLAIDEVNVVLHRLSQNTEEEISEDKIQLYLDILV